MMMMTLPFFHATNSNKASYQRQCEPAHQVTSLHSHAHTRIYMTMKYYAEIQPGNISSLNLYVLLMCWGSEDQMPCKCFRSRLTQPMTTVPQRKTDRGIGYRIRYNYW